MTEVERTFSCTPAAPLPPLPLRAGDVTIVTCKLCGHEESQTWQDGQEDMYFDYCPNCETLAWSYVVLRPC